MNNSEVNSGKKTSTKSSALTLNLFFISSSFFTLILLPNSLSLLRLGRFEFAWGFGDIILFLAFLPFFGEIILKGKTKFLSGVNRLDKVLLLYFISLLFPVGIALVRYPGRAIFTIAGYLKYLEALIIYLLIRRSVKGKNQANYLLNVFIFVIIGVLIISLVQKGAPLRFLSIIRSQSRTLQQGYINSLQWRLSGPFFNPNTLAEVILLAVPLTWALFEFKSNVYNRLFYLSLIMFSIIIFILTGSREAYLGFLGMLLSLVYFKRSSSLKTKKIYIFLIIILLGLVLFYRFYLMHRIVEYTFRQPGFGYSAIVRVKLWEVCINLMDKYWLIGAGFGNSSIAISEALPWHSSIGGTHNTFFRAFLDGGIFVFGIFLFLLFRIWSLHKVKLSEPWNCYKNALISGFVGLVITGFFGDTFQNSELMIFFMFLLGVVNSIYYLARGKGLRK